MTACLFALNILPKMLIFNLRGRGIKKALGTRLVGAGWGDYSRDALSLALPPFCTCETRRLLIPGRGTPLYGLNRYLRPHRVWFSAILVSTKASIFADFGDFGRK